MANKYIKNEKNEIMSFAGKWMECGIYKKIESTWSKSGMIRNVEVTGENGMWDWREERVIELVNMIKVHGLHVRKCNNETP
jgi:hypothetical protein